MPPRKRASTNDTADEQQEGRNQPPHSSSKAKQLANTALGVAFAPVTIAQQALPRSQPAVYYTGLAAAAVVDVIDWPVAAAIAAGVWVARRRGEQRHAPGAQPS